MTTVRLTIPQTDPPRSPKETLPTMYDLKSEDVGDAGLLDEYHLWQAEFLSSTFYSPAYPRDRLFFASDLNLYYDPKHPSWYKRPDWFAVAGVPRFYEGKELRLSYVFWQEGVRPTVIVEFLSPGTRNEDLGRDYRKAEVGRQTDDGSDANDSEKPPSKWEVYERILAVPYYILFDRYTDELQAFELRGDRYQNMSLEQPQVWIPSLQIGLGAWQGQYRGKERLWLRWYGAESNWLPTEVELVKQQLEKEQQKAERLAEHLRAMGIDPDAIA